MVSRGAFSTWSADRPYLHSFPTRRSSDLSAISFTSPSNNPQVLGLVSMIAATSGPSLSLSACASTWPLGLAGTSSTVKPAKRSEEHTSELQSHVNLVCRLLLEKKKTRTRT